MPAGADDQHLARLDVAHVGRANQIHRARFRADDERVAEPAERERPEPVRIANRNQPIPGQHHERERALHLRRPTRRWRPRRFAAFDRAYRCSTTSVSLLDWKIDPWRRARRAARRALTRLPLWQMLDLAVRAVDQKRLRVRQPALARRRIADVPDGQRARAAAPASRSSKTSAT